MKPEGKVITENNRSRNQSTYYLEEGNYVTGYYATLVYVMSGLVKAVYVLETFQKNKYEILSKNCELASVPLFEVHSLNEEFKDVEVFAVVDKPQIKV
jgi:ribosomal protein L30E